MDQISDFRPGELRADASIEIDRAAAVYLSAFAILVLYFLIWPIWRAQFPLEIWYTEGFNAYLQDAAAAGRKLYPSPDSLVGNNYPPLSFYVVGWLGKVFSDPLYVGRALSIVGLLCVSVEIFLCVRLLAGHNTGAAIGALWYAAVMCHHQTFYVGTNDPQLAGEAIMGAALVWFIARDQAGMSATPALLLMVVAGFWKHNMVGIPLTSICWVLLRDGRRAARPLLLAAAAIITGLLLCRVVFGSAFIADMMGPRVYRMGGVLANVGHLQWVALAFAIWASWAIGDRASSQARFTAVLIVISLATCLLQWTGDGVSGNAEFDLIIAIGIGIGVTFNQLGRTWLARYIRPMRVRDMMVMALLLRLVATDRQESALVLFSPEFRSYFSAGQKAVANDAAAVAKIPGDVFCTTKIVCRLAGKPFAVDEFKFEQLIKTGGLNGASANETLRRRSVTAFVNDRMTMADPDTSFFSKLWRRAPL
jgi:hypothetical protein